MQQPGLPDFYPAILRGIGAGWWPCRIYIDLLKAKWFTPAAAQASITSITR